MDLKLAIKQAAIIASMEKRAFNWGEILRGMGKGVSKGIGKARDFTKAAPEWIGAHADQFEGLGKGLSGIGDTVRFGNEALKQVGGLVTGTHGKEMFRTGLNKGLLWGGIGGFAIPNLVSTMTRPRYGQEEYR